MAQSTLAQINYILTKLERTDFLIWNGNNVQSFKERNYSSERRNFPMNNDTLFAVDPSSGLGWENIETFMPKMTDSDLTALIAE